MSSGRRRAGRALALGAALLACLSLTACGSSALSGAQLRTSAGRICRVATRRSGRIAVPTAPTQGARFISQGIAALDPGRHALARLDPPGPMRDQYERAIAAVADELTAMRSALTGLRAGNDPVVAIRTLQQELRGPEGRAAAAWDALRVPECAALTA